MGRFGKALLTWLTELHPSRRIKGESDPCIFQLLETACIPRFMAISLWPFLPSSHLFLWLWLSRLPCIRTLVIKFSSFGYLHLRILDHICKVLLPCKLTYSQIQRIRKGHLREAVTLSTTVFLVIFKDSYPFYMPNTFTIFKVTEKSQLIIASTQSANFLLNLISWKSQIL